MCPTSNYADEKYRSGISESVDELHIVATLPQPHRTGRTATAPTFSAECLYPSHPQELEPIAWADLL
jgi:hypothetical protein